MSIINKIEKDIKLARYSTFKIGGQAQFFVKVKTSSELIESIIWAENQKIGFTILGGGSNILINDDGVAGLVIKTEIDDHEITADKLTFGAGVRLSQAVILAYENSLSGMEWAVGIPGLIGGAVRGNAGAFGFETGDNIDKVITYDTVKRTIVEYTKFSSRFKYRSSIFKLQNNLIILKVIFKLKKEDKSKIKELMDVNLKKRLLNLPKGQSAGSIFKNVPINDLLSDNSNLLTKADKEKVIKDKKVPAAWIIDQLDLKGKVIGGAKISDEHANVIINYQQATSGDIVALISLIKTNVRDKLNLQLHEEIEYIGF